MKNAIRLLWNYFRSEYFHKFILLLNNSKAVHKKPNLKRSNVKVMEAAIDSLLKEFEVCLFVFIPFDCMLKGFPYDLN